MPKITKPTPTAIASAAKAGKFKTFPAGTLRPLDATTLANVTKNIQASAPRVQTETSLSAKQVTKVINTIVAVLPNISFVLPSGGASTSGVSGCDGSHECTNHHGGCDGMQECDGLSQCDVESCSGHDCSGTHSCGENDCEDHSCADQQCAPEHANTVVTAFASTSKTGVPAFKLNTWNTLVSQFAKTGATAETIKSSLRIYVKA